MDKEQKASIIKMRSDGMTYSESNRSMTTPLQ